MLLSHGFGPWKVYVTILQMVCDDPVCTLMISDDSFIVQTTCKLNALVENISVDQTGPVEHDL
uniref:Uncharacterized protein n=1 Tax=Aegilops tauschii subsp. strangulata TaxID=200361 RepID=A0A453EM10_AEGTS